MITLSVITTGGGDFASLRAALDSLPNPLVDAVTINCSGTSADTLNVTQTHWDHQTSAANYIRVVGNRPGGAGAHYQTGYYRIEVSDGDGIYNNGASHVRLENLQVQLTVTTSVGDDFNAFRLATANNFVTPVDHRYKNCVARLVISGGATDNLIGFVDSDPGGTGGTAKRMDCVVVGSGQSGFTTDDTAWAATNVINYNCTSYGHEFNYLNGQICLNCLGAASTLGDPFDFLATTTSGSSNNMSSDSSAVGTNSLTNRTFSFVDAANGDLHLQTTDVGAKDLGVTDPSSGLYSDDIDGQTRSAPWDVGADEVGTASTKPMFRGH